MNATIAALQEANFDCVDPINNTKEENTEYNGTKELTRKYNLLLSEFFSFF